MRSKQDVFWAFGLVSLAQLGNSCLVLSWELLCCMFRLWLLLQCWRSCWLYVAPDRRALAVCCFSVILSFRWSAAVGAPAVLSAPLVS